jgi:hypothetical protein
MREDQLASFVAREPIAEEHVIARARYELSRALPLKPCLT